MDVREKLVGLLKTIPQVNHAEAYVYGTDYVFGCAAGYLIANGVTVQECKVGDNIYEVDGEHGIIKHEVYEVCVVFKTTATDDKGNEWDDYWTSEDIGSAFKTRNEAEAHLPQPQKGE